MAKTKIEFDLESSEFSTEEIRIISECLSIKREDINSVLVKIAKTALMEYIKMFKEKGLPTRADEVMQERLFFLLLYYYIDRLPLESEISAIFQLTQSQSATLLRNTISRYRIKIQRYITNTLQAVIKSAKKNDETDNFEMIIKSKIILEELNRIIAQQGPSLVQISKKKGIASLYTCPEDTYNLLKKMVGL
jgi:ribosomal protein L22